MNLAERVREALEKSKSEYIYVALTPNADLRLIRSKYKLWQGKKFLGFYLEYCDGIFGKHIAESRAKNWEYLGKL